VPLNLWNKLVDSACGQDISGNLLPFERLKEYDERMGTSHRIGLGDGQILAEQARIVEAVKFTILNTSVTTTFRGQKVPEFIHFLNINEIDKYFDTAESTRQILDRIWQEAKPKQVNEIFFAVMHDALANNLEFKDVFKTSRLSLHSIKTVNHKNATGT
jgi:hypothetical protein